MCISLFTLSVMPWNRPIKTPLIILLTVACPIKCRLTVCVHNVELTSGYVSLSVALYLAAASTIPIHIDFCCGILLQSATRAGTR